MALIHRIGGFFCHQISERSLTANGFVLPVCARCTGLYLGVLISLLIFICVKKQTTAKADLAAVLLCVSGIPLLVFDVLAINIGLYESTSLIRLITGFAAGYPLPLFLCYANGKGFPNKRLLCVILAVLTTFAFLVYNGLLNYYIACLLIYAGFITLWGGIAIAVYAHIKQK